MKKTIMLAVLVGCLPLQTVALELKTQEQRYSYTLGTRMAGLLKGEGIGKVDGEAFGAGVADVINGVDLRLTADEMTEALRIHHEQMRKERAEKAKKKLAEGKKFLAENAKKPNIHVLESGLQYEVLKTGDGPKPQANDKVSVHYEGRLISGKKFDSSYDRGQPATFTVNGVIKGFGEALTRMNVGSKWRIFVPPELGYGARGAGAAIGPNETLIFELELLDIVSSGKEKTKG